MTDARVGRIHIDLGDIVREAAVPVGANLVTRPTGRAVRSAIERRLAGARRSSVTVIDFSRVSVLDFSCADEVVARLLLGHLSESGEDKPSRPAELRDAQVGGGARAPSRNSGPKGTGRAARSSRDASAPPVPRTFFFLFRVLDEVRGHSVSEALARRGLGAVCDICGARFRLLGAVSKDERAAWTTVEARGRIPAGQANALLGRRGEDMLRSLARRRLVYRDADGATTALSVLARGPTPLGSGPNSQP